jgi:ATP/ADP translocase
LRTQLIGATDIYNDARHIYEVRKVFSCFFIKLCTINNNNTLYDLRENFFLQNITLEKVCFLSIINEKKSVYCD